LKDFFVFLNFTKEKKAKKPFCFLFFKLFSFSSLSFQKPYLFRMRQEPKKTIGRSKSAD